MAAIYKTGVVLTIPKYDLGHPNNAANVIAWSTGAVGLTVAQLTAVQTAFDTAWSAKWAPQSPTINRYMGCWVIDMAGPTANQVTNATYTPVLGTAGSGAWADSIAGLLSLKTQTRYRGGHGRLYIPGFNSGSLQSDGQSLSTAAITAIQQMWDNTVAALLALSGATGGPYTPIVWHKRLTAAPNTIEPVVGRVVQTTAASQRRRLRKVTRRRSH